MIIHWYLSSFVILTSMDRYQEIFFGASFVIRTKAPELPHVWALRLGARNCAIKPIKPPRAANMCATWAERTDGRVAPSDLLSGTPPSERL